MRLTLMILLALIVNQAFCQSTNSESKPAANSTKPALAWKFQTNGPVVGSPVIDNGTVFIGSLDSTLYALDLATGKVRWKFPTNGAIRSSVCIVPDGLFLLSSDGLLYRLERDSGRINGFFQTTNSFMGDRQYDYADYFTSTPVIVDSAIYFGSGETIYAISIKDGNIQWTYKTGDLVHTTPAISKGKLYAGSFDGNIYAIDIKTGSLFWKFKTTGKYSFPRGEVTGNPVVAGGLVFAGARDYNLYAIDVKGGFSSWMKQFKYGWGLPVTVNDSVILVGTSDDRMLYELNLLTGNEVWKTPTGFNVFGGCAIDGSTAYFGTLAGKLNGLDLKTGKINWTIELEGYKTHRYSYFKPDDSYRLDIAKIIKTPLDMLVMYRQLGGVFGKPAISGNQIVVAGYDGWVYCFQNEVK